MILAAGFGTRLSRVGLRRPKPLLPVCGLPLVRFALAQMAAASIREVVINLHHEGGLIRRELGDGSELGMELSYSVEEGQILGTGGGVRKVRDFFGGRTFVVMNGKIVSDADLRAAVAFHRRKSALATMVLHPDSDPFAWGAVQVDAEGWIRKVAGFESSDPKAVGRPLAPYVFTGIHVLEPEFLDSVPEGPQCIVRTAYRRHVQASGRVAGFVAEGYWHDHSTPTRYLRGNFNLVDRSEPLWPGHGLGALNGTDPSAWVSEDAEVWPPVRICAGARIDAGAVVGPHAVIGPRARVNSGVTLSRCVVWEDVQVGRSWDSVVVTEAGPVPVDLSDEGARIGPPIQR